MSASLKPRVVDNETSPEPSKGLVGAGALVANERGDGGAGWVTQRGQG
jgi:hypothetical protein